MLESIKQGFTLANRNYHLVLLRIGVKITNLIGILLFLVFPIIAAIAYLGIDLAQTSELLPFFIQNPLGFISGYLGLILVTVLALMFYIVFASALMVYVLSGTLGVLRNSAVNLRYKSSLTSFLKEANRNFIRLIWVITLESLIFIGLISAGIAITGTAAVAARRLAGVENYFEMFIGSFLLLTCAVFGGIIIIVSAIFAVYSIVIAVMERTGATDSIKKTYGFLKQKPGAILLCICLFAGAVVVNILFLFVKIPFHMAPEAGLAIKVFLFAASAVLQSYLAVVLWASLLSYYIKSTAYPVYSAEYEI